MNSKLDPDVVSYDFEPAMPYEPTDEDYKEANYWRAVWDLVDSMHERGFDAVLKDIFKAAEDSFRIDAELRD